MAFNRVLLRLADWSLWGAIVLVLALPIVTLPAAIAAGTAASRAGNWAAAAGAALRTFGRTFVRGSIAGTALTLVAAWGVVLVTLNLEMAGTVVGAFTRGVGTALVAASAFAVPYVGCALTERASAQRLVRSVRRLAVLAPFRGITHVALTGTGVAAAGLFPILLIPVLGAIAANAAAIPSSAAQRIERHRGSLR